MNRISIPKSIQNNKYYFSWGKRSCITQVSFLPFQKQQQKTSFNTNIILNSKPSLSSSCSSNISTSNFSSITRGQDLLAESLAHGSKRKIILDSYYPEVGVDVIGMIEYTQKQNDASNDEDLDSSSATSTNNDDMAKIITQRRAQQQKQQQFNNRFDEEESQPQNLLMNSSIIAFPNSCFLWNGICNSKDVTVESLSFIQLLEPSIEFLFIGCDDPLPPRELNKIKKQMKEQCSIVVEQMDVMNAMGTFNILNGEDRRVAVAIVVDVGKKESGEL